MAKKRVLVDTCVILPAVALKQWNLLCGKFDIETVELVVQETQQPTIERKRYVPVTREDLARIKVIHPVSEDARIALHEKLINIGVPPPDAGEFDLFAHILEKETPSPNVLLLTTADRKAAVVACSLGWMDSLVSLENLLSEAGSTRGVLGKLENQATEKFLSDVRGAFKMDAIRKKSP